MGGISSSVSKDDLEEEFSTFGKIEDLRFLRERKTAFIDYYDIDAALQARNMNGTRMGGSYLRVDFLRSQAPRKVNHSCNTKFSLMKNSLPTVHILTLSFYL